MSFPRYGLIASLALAGSLLPLALSAQSYGLEEQVLTVGAASFRGEARQPVSHGDGYLYDPDPNASQGGAYYAPFRLPDGALITRLCGYFRSEEPSPSQVIVGVLRVRVAPGEFTNGVSSRFFVNPNFNFGYGEFCTAPLVEVFHDDLDADGNLSIDHVSYRLRAALVPGATVGFGGVRIFWRRQVGPAPAQPAFGDVPASAPFFQYVEALAASAITGGCGNGNFCPNAPLTRGQMAVFLSKALGLQWP